MSRRIPHWQGAGNGPDHRPGRDSGGHTHAGLAAISSKIAAEAQGVDDCDFVRPAGPEAMRDPPRRRWELEDEASDQSFPASDPPGTY